MISNFEPYAKLLQKLGNTRMPYTILVDKDSKVDCAQSGLRLPVAKTILTTTGYASVKAFDNVINVASNDEIVERLFACNDIVCIVIANADIMQTECSVLFNEVHVGHQLTCGGFKLLKQYNDNFAYVKQLIDDPNIIAISVKNIVDTVSIDGFEPWQPWHTLLLNKSTNEALQIIWDTRQIVGYAKLPDHVYNAALYAANANDNCTMLYDCIGLQNRCKSFDHIIIDSIQ